MKNVCIHLFVVAAQVGSEKLPLDRFYRFIFPTQPSFSKEGILKENTQHFSRLPVGPTLTLGMDVPEAWLVRPYKSPFDLDNIKLSTHVNQVDAEFTLSYILVQGHAQESSGEPPKGMQFVLGTPTHPDLVDTITMANLGYFQLKAQAGVWKLNIRQGRSADIYQFQKVVNGKLAADGALVVVSSFEGVIVYPNVIKKAGMEKEDVLDESGSGPKIVDKVKWAYVEVNSRLFGKKETINVFSVASGHLYERFLSIMMLSVKQQTKNKLKFWLIENFLSPSFIEFLPFLAEAYDFEYEFVTCNQYLNLDKWPYWLRHQTEKQRTIWGCIIKADAR
jgi:UDP-glucose:glycoprotein glucosyltransferase